MVTARWDESQELVILERAAQQDGSWLCPQHSSTGQLSRAFFLWEKTFAGGLWWVQMFCVSHPSRSAGVLPAPVTWVVQQRPNPPSDSAVGLLCAP